MQVNEQSLRKIEPRMNVGLVVVLTGDGKGKTTSALGMALRAVGHGMKVCIIHFMKGDLYSGELNGVRRLAPEVEVHLTGKGFFVSGGGPALFNEHRRNVQDALALAKEKIASGSFDIVVLDEINNALALGLVELPQVLALIDTKPPLLHLVLTGRDAHPDVIARAHTVTEMREIKHAFRKDIEPQKGIDY
jgi:cob(I)alamin adenosyltransferase